MLQTLLARVSTFDIAAHLRLPLQAFQTSHHTPCPVCRARMWVLRSGFVCENKDCPLLACSTLDMLCLFHPDQAYDGALDELIGLSGRWQNEALQMMRVSSDDLLREAKSQRAIFSIMIRLAKGREKLGRVGASQIYSWLTKQGYEASGIDRTLFVASPQDILDLNAQLGCTSMCDPMEVPKQHVVLIPYFSAHHEVSRIVGMDPFSTWEAESEVLPARYAFSGLLQANAGTSTLSLVNEDHFAAARSNSREGADRMAVAVIYNARSARVGYKPGSDSVFYSGKGCSLLVADMLRSEAPQMIFSADGLDAPGKVWTQFLGDRLLHELDASGRLTHAGEAVFGGLRIEQADRQRLLIDCIRLGHPDAAADLRKIFNTNIIFTDRTYKLFASPGGYQIQHVKGGSRETIANFTVELNANVVFREEGALYHKGVATFGGENYDIMLSSRDLESPTVIEEALQRLTIKRGAADDAMPVVRDRKAFKTVAACLREQVGFMQHVEGVEALGWNFKRDTFFGPCWKAGLDGSEEKAFCFHPGNPLLEHYTNQPRAVVETAVTEFPAALRDLASMLVAFVVRAYTNYPIRGVLVQHTPGTQMLVETVFSYLGQTRGITRINYDAAKTHGYPVYGFNYNAQQAHKLGLPLISLSGSGMHWEDCQEVAAAQLGIFLRSLLPSVCEWLLSSAGDAYARKPHILYASELIEEGCGVIRQVAGRDWAASPVPFACVEKILRETSYEDLPKNWAYDFERQLIRYTYTPTDELVILNAELRSLTQTTVMTPRCFEMDAGSAFALLGHFYGKEPMLPMISLVDVGAKS